MNAAGPVPSSQLHDLAKQAGHAWRTIERARERIGGTGSRGAGRWQWWHPDDLPRDGSQP